MAAKLNKTETKLIASLKASDSNRIGVERYHGQGGDGGRVSGGSREFNAGLSLIEKKLVVREGEIHRSTLYKNGYAVHVSSMTLREPLPGEKLPNGERHPHETRAGIRRQYHVKDSIIMSLGKFEREPVFAPYFAHTASFGEELSHIQDGAGDYVSLIAIDVDDRAEFPELSDDAMYVLLTENEQGFVSVRTIDSEDEAARLREAAQAVGEEEDEPEEEGEEETCDG